MRISNGIGLVALTAFIAACADQPLAPNLDLAPNAGVAGAAAQGAVYLMSNAPEGNAILVFDRASDGSLGDQRSYATGGEGTGTGLGNQESLTLTKNGRHLFAVNAGSNDISAFEVSADDLVLTGAPVDSRGEQPISLAVHGKLLYVLNAGGAGGIAGFTIGRDGALTQIAGSERPLSSAAAGAAQIAFSPDGRTLVVTEKATDVLSTYVVGSDGVAQGPLAQESAGGTPFGFRFNQTGDLIVSEAAGGAPGGSTASSYQVGRDGVLELISAAVATTQTAACWLEISQDGRFAYTANTGSSSISSLAIGPDGSLTLVDAVAATSGPGSLPQDASFSNGGRFLYVRNLAGNVGAFSVASSGRLTHIGDFGTLPAGANGMAAR